MTIGEPPAGYRPNVGVALFSSEGRVFGGFAHNAGPEIVLPGHEWQMPQGGIDPGEDIETAARRELFEETGVAHVSLLAVTDSWWSYEFPAYDGPAHRLARFRGQTQRWAAFRLEGDDSEIDISKPNGDFPPEFSEWRWWDLNRLAKAVTPHRRAVYAQVAKAFTQFMRPGP